MKKLMVTLLCLVVLVIGTPAGFAYAPYESYTYSTQTGKAVAQYCPTPYYPAFSIDKTSIGVPLVTPTCMCFDKDGNLYITDSSTNRLLVLDKDYKLKANIDTIEDDQGNFDFFGGPEGIFVTDEGEIYICDTKQKRILVLDKDYRLVRKYEGIKPINTTEEEYMFLPTRIVVDASKNMYVLIQNEYQGIMQIDNEGRFISFVGGNKVTYDPITKLWKKLMSKEQREQLDQFLPVEYTNLSQDSEGLIYTVSKADNSDPIKRLNLSGKDVLIRNGYTDVIGDVIAPTGKQGEILNSLFVDIVSDENGLIYALDANRGRVFVYNNEGFLFYVFGGIGTQLGTFSTPSAIEVNGTDILVADQGNPRITVFRRTEYASLISKADEAYNTGLYDESVRTWNQVIERNSNFELAYAQIGKVYLRRNQYEDAMRYFELGNFRGDKITNTTGYNKAFSEYRRQTAAKWLGPIVITIVVIALGVWVFRLIKKKKGHLSKKGGER